MYQRILVALDGSPEAEAILPEVEKLVKVAPCQVILLRVTDPVDIETALQEMKPSFARGVDGIDVFGSEYTDSYYMLSNTLEQEVRHYLDGIGERFAKLGATPLVEVSFNTPADEIVFFAQHYDADLIAMATHARTGLNRLLQGSVTESVMRHARCPMLIVKAA